MTEKIFLRSRIESAGTGNPTDDFAPYLKSFLLDGTADPLGAVLVLPGGGYSHRAHHEGDPVARRFNELGFHAFVLEYRIKPYVFPAPVRDVLRAVRIIRSNAAQWRVAPDQIAVGGFSAGGHLACCCGTMYDKVNCDEGDEFDAASPRPDAMLLCYALTNVTESYGHAGSGLNLLGVDSFDRVPDAKKLDLVSYVNPDTPPTFLWHTANDQAVNRRNSLIFADALWAADVPAELHMFPDGRHGLGLAYGHPDVSVWPELAARFLRTTVKFAGR